MVYECLLQEPMEANGEPASIEIDFTFSKVITILDFLYLDPIGYMSGK